MQDVRTDLDVSLVLVDLGLMSILHVLVRVKYHWVHDTYHPQFVRVRLIHTRSTTDHQVATVVQVDWY